MQECDSAKPRGTLFGSKYSSVQNIDMDAAEEDPTDAPASTHLLANATTKVLARIGLVDPDGTPQPEAICRAFVGVFVACIVLSVTLLHVARGDAGSLPPPAIREESPTWKHLEAPELPADRYVANRGFTCKLDKAVGNALADVSLPPSKTSSAGEPCWSEAQALAVARAVQECTFVTNEVPEVGGGRCVTSMHFCEDPVSGLEETIESTNLVTCRVLDLPDLRRT